MILHRSTAGTELGRWHSKKKKKWDSGVGLSVTHSREWGWGGRLARARPVDPQVLRRHTQGYGPLSHTGDVLSSGDEKTRTKREVAGSTTPRSTSGTSWLSLAFSTVHTEPGQHDWLSLTSAQCKRNPGTLSKKVRAIHISCQPAAARVL